MKRMTAKLTGALVGFLLFAAAVTTAAAPTLDELAARGEALANADPLAVELRNREPEGPSRRGFDIGMGAAEGHTAPGPGKDRIRDSLPAAEQAGFNTAVTFSLERNSNAELAAKGAVIAKVDPLVAKARTADPSVFYWLGFDIATGIFGDPALGANGNTATGAGSLRIRDSLSAAGQRGFNAAVTFHLSRKYTRTSGGVTEPAKSGSRSAFLTAFVTNEKDGGEGSLREAFNQANARPGTTIQLPKDKWLIIYPTSPLPPITANGTVLDGPSGTVYVKPEPFPAPPRPTSYTGPLAWILGVKAGKAADGLVVQANNCTVRGLVISEFAHNQMAISGSGTKVNGCYLGTTPDWLGRSGGSDGYSPSVSFGATDALGDLVRALLNTTTDANGDTVSATRRHLNHGATIYVGGGARSTVLGGAEAGARNFIWNNAQTNAGEGSRIAVQVAGNAANGTTIRGNVFNSTGPGIVFDADTQRVPEITQVLPGVVVTIQGVLNSVPNTEFAVNFYSNGVPVGTTSVATDDGGSASFEVVSSIPNRSDQFIAATATHLKTGDTSAFSAARSVGGATISGQVIWNNPFATGVGQQGPPGFSDVEVTLRQGAAVLTTTRSDYPAGAKLGGYYRFCHLLPDTYTVAAGRRDLLLLPESRTVTLGTTDATKVDFLGTKN